MKSNLKNVEELLKASQQYAQTILNSLSAHIAIIDKNGIILETNRAWQQFALSNDIRMRPDTLYVNYLEICDAAEGESSEKSRDVADGIRRVINHEVDEFLIDYPCHSPGEERWFYLRAVRWVGMGPLRVILSHENITALKVAERCLKEREEELETNNIRLGEANAALRALLRQRDEDKSEMEETVFRNIREMVLPYFDRLKQTKQREVRQQLIELIESGLNDIASPFLRKLSSIEVVLTPQEIQIATMIKEGKSTKEIARIMNLSVTTINFHRRNLRDKLGLKNTTTNLRAYLLSLKK